MMRGVRCLFVLFLSILLTSCGGGATVGNESTGSFCANAKGLNICLVNISPQYMGSTETPNLTTEVDVFPISDCDPTQDGDQPEPYWDHTAIVSFQIRALNPYADIPPNTTIILERYTIDYRISTDSFGGPPIERYEGYTSWVLPAPLTTVTSTEAKMLAIFVDVPRKNSYYNDLASGRYSSRSNLINNYTATVTFYGRTDTGDRFSIVGNALFSMGAYNYCNLRS